MKSLILCFISATLLLMACSDESTDQEVPAPEKHVIELITFGSADEQSVQNKGYGILYYCYLNLETDSVFIQRRIDPLENPEDLAWTGTIKGLAEKNEIVSFIEASNRIENGGIAQTKPTEGSLYCGASYFSSYIKGGVERYHFYRRNSLDSGMDKGVGYMLGLHQSPEIKPVKIFVNPDRIIVPVVSKKGLEFGPPPPPELPPPPPPVRIKLK